MNKKILFLIMISFVIMNRCNEEKSSENNIPSKPALTSPSNSATDIQLNATLNWTASTDKDGDALKYTVLFSTDNPPKTTVSLLQTGTSFTPTLTANTKYYWLVTVTDGNGGVAISETWSFTTIANNPTNQNPSKPSLTTPIDQSVDVILSKSLDWQAALDPDGDVVKYFVLLSTNNPPNDTVARSLTTTTYSPELNQNTKYYWQIISDDGKGGRNLSDVYTFTTISSSTTNQNPSKPSLTSPIDQSVDVILSKSLDWQIATDPDGDVVKYFVLLSTNNPPNDTVARLLTTTTYSPSLSQSTKYYWQIISDDGKGGRNLSDVYYFTTISSSNSNPPSVPKLIHPLNGTLNVQLNYKIIWNSSIDPEGLAVKYKVYFGTSNPPALVSNTAQPDTFYTPTLASNVKYYWKIEAIDPSGASSESEIRNFTTTNTSNTNITLSSPPHTSTKIALNEPLTWNAWTSPNGGSVTYTVYLGTQSASLTALSSDQTATTFETSSANLMANTTYYWKVIAKDNSGNTSTSEIFSFTTISNPPPKATTPVPAHNLNNVPLNQVLSWNAVTDGTNTITYTVFLSTSNPPLTKVSESKTANTYTHSTALAGNKTYYWQVIVDNGTGGLSESDIWSFKTINAAPNKPSLTTPINLATNISLTETLNWNSTTDPDGDVVKYDVYFGTSDPPTTKVSPLQTTTSYSPSLSLNTKYYWRVSANDGSGGITQSDIRSFTTKVTLSTAPVLTYPTNSATNISITPTLTWNASTATSGATFNYTVYLDKTTNPITLQGSSQTALTKTVYNLENGTVYYWKVVAEGNGETLTSQIFSFTTVAGTSNTPPPAPTLTAPDDLAGNVPLTQVLSWNSVTDVDGDVVKYEVFLGTSTPLNSVASSLTATSYTPNPTLNAGTKYFWYVNASDNKGGVTSSVTRSFSTPSLIAAPELLSPIDQATNQELKLTFNWRKSLGNGTFYYNLIYDINPFFNSGNQKESGFKLDTFINIENLNSNQKYYWKVAVRDRDNFIKESSSRFFNTKQVDPTAPIIKEPQNNAVNVSLNPTLIWNSSKCFVEYPCKYTLYYTTSSSVISSLDNLKVISTVVKIENLTDTFYQPKLLSNQTYYWGISVDDLRDGYFESSIGKFRTVIEPPSKPKLIFPLNNTTLLTLNEKLTWNISTSSSNYTLLYNVYFGTSLEQLTKVSSRQTKSEYVPTLEPYKTYYWKIETDDDNGGISLSDTFSFKTPFTEMINVIGGTFNMGCTSEQDDDGGTCDADESPVDTVTISSFKIAKYEVTEKDWTNIVGGSPNPASANKPVNYRTYNDVIDFISKLNTQTGLTYRLPTEAEWEFAARGGKNTKNYIYSGSNTATDVGWIKDNALWSDVGQKTPNELGIYDMTGNVSEWCSGEYYAYTGEVKTNPNGGTSASGKKALRGANFTSERLISRISKRYFFNPASDKGDWSGFRLVLDNN